MIELCVALFMSAVCVFPVLGTEELLEAITQEDIASISEKNGTLIFVIKKERWTHVRHLTTRLRGRKVLLVVNGKTVASPYIRDPTSFEFQLVGSSAMQEELKALKELLPGRSEAVPVQEKVTFLQGWLAEHPQDETALVEMVRLLHETEEVEDARTALELFYARPDDAMRRKAEAALLLQLADCFCDIGQNGRAIALLEGYQHSAESDRFQLNTYLGALYEEAHQLGKALRSYRVALGELERTVTRMRREYCQDDISGLEEMEVMAERERVGLKKKIAQLKTAQPQE